jgi:hypothetical protein
MVTEYTPDNLDDHNRAVEPGPESKQDASLAGKSPSGAPAWFISTGVHGLLALIFCAIVFSVREQQVELPPMRQTQIDAPIKPVPRNSDPVETNFPEIVINDKVTDSPVLHVDVPVEETNTTDSDDVSHQSKGHENAVASIETGSTGAFLAIGAAGGGAGIFGHRKGSDKARAIARDSSAGSVKAVGGALRWLKRHQSANGSWDVEKYPLNCSDAQKCEPGSLASANGSDANVAMTGYALLCFLGDGNDTKTGRYQNCVRKGLAYLCSVQKADGMFGNRNYENAVATMALAEAYAMSADPALMAPAQNGVKAILARQAKDAKAADQQYAGLGWNYTDPDPNRNDSSVSGWNVMALKSAAAAGLQVGNGMNGAKSWLERAWKASNKNWQTLNDPYTSESGFPYTWAAGSDAVDMAAPGSATKDMAPVGAICAIFLGHHDGDMMLESLCNHIMKHQLPISYPCNTYYMYYNSLAMFQVGGDRWKKWNATMQDILVKAQRQDNGCLDGSWDWQGTVFPGSDTGRILSTAYCCLCLEVCYRYDIVHGITTLRSHI